MRDGLDVREKLFLALIDVKDGGPPARVIVPKRSMAMLDCNSV